MKGENSKMRAAVCGAMVAVTAVTVFMVKGSMDQAQENRQAVVRENRQTLVQGNGQTNQSSANQQGGNSSGGSTAGGLTEADYAAAQAYAMRYGGEWNVEKYFDGAQWKIYELGKRMAIVAYNFLNDGSYTTGGYDRIVGWNHKKEITYIEGTDEVIDERWVGSTPIYEYVPLERHEYHGKDIEYSTPSITISDDTVDMSGMGGPVFNLAMFHVETINGQEYLINDAFKFAITFDGDYLEYCQPDTYGYYQGYYAYLRK